MRLHLGCGSTHKAGFVNVDICSPADIIHDLNSVPWPFADSSVNEVFSEHTLEHLKEPEAFWKELYRILKPGSIATIIVPHKDSKGAYSTFGHRSFFHECAIANVTHWADDNILNFGNFIHLRTEVTRGRLLFWQKRDIKWVVKKPEVKE